MSEATDVQKALELGQQNARDIVGLTEKLDGHIEVCTAKEAATHEKLDNIAKSQTDIKRIILSGVGALIVGLFYVVWQLLTHPGLGLSS